jgi:hypothetical protein
METRKLFLADQYDQVRSTLFKNYIKIKDDNDRMILYPSTKGCNLRFDIPAVSECNGLILDSKFNILAYPIPLFQPENLVDYKQLKKDYDINYDINSESKYKCYFAEYGTVVNLYYYEFLDDNKNIGKWTMSTVRGYEVNDVKWNNLTYEKMFSECVNKDFDIFCKKLDKKYTYSFVFTHPDMHPFHQITNCIFIRRTNNEDGTFDEINNFENVNSQTECHLTFDEITKLNNDSYDKFLNKSDIAEFKKNIFGFIFRSVDSKNNVFISSTLTHVIRKLYTSKHYNQESQNYNRNNYVLLYNFILRKETFLSVFPCFTDQMNTIEKKYVNLCNSIISELRNMNIVNYKPEDSKSNHIIHSIINNIRDLISINVDDVYFSTILKQVVYQLNMIPFIYQWIFDI